MEKRTLLSFFKPINSPKTSLLEEPEKKVEKSVEPILEKENKPFNNGVDNSTEGTNKPPAKGSDNTTKGIQKESKQTMENVLKEKTATKEKRKRQPEDAEELSEPRKKVKKSAEPEKTENPGIKKNSIQNFFKKKISTPEIKSNITEVNPTSHEVIEEKQEIKEDKPAAVQNSPEVIEVEQAIEAKSARNATKKILPKKVRKSRLVDSGGSATQEVIEVTEDAPEVIRVPSKELSQSFSNKMFSKKRRKTRVIDSDSDVSVDLEDSEKEEEPEVNEMHATDTEISGKEVTKPEVEIPKKEVIEVEIPEREVTVIETEIPGKEVTKTESLCDGVPAETTKSKTSEKVLLQVEDNADKSVQEEAVNRSDDSQKSPVKNLIETKVNKVSTPSTKSGAKVSITPSPGVKNAFAMMMKRTPKTPKVTEEHKDETALKDYSIVGTSSLKESVSDVKCDLQESEVKGKVEEIKREDVETEVKNNEDFHTPSRKPKVKDARLSNMLSVLSSIQDDDDDDVEVADLDFTPKTRKKKRKLRTPLPDKQEQEPRQSEQTSRKDEVMNVLEAGEKGDYNQEQGPSGIHEVVCRGKSAKIDFAKFNSGGKGACVLYEETWMTPNEFEKIAGSRAKKYKVSLHVNNRPLQEMLGSTHNSNNSSGCSTPSQLPSASSKKTDTLLKSAARKIKRRRIISDSSDNDTNLSQESNDAANQLVTIDEDIKIADEKKDEDDGEVEVDESLNSRRSGRIARNQDKMDEKKREQQKLEQELQKMDKKENERKKKGRLVMLPIKDVQEESEANEEDSDCIELDSESDSENEKKKSKPSKQSSKPSGKLAPLFMSKKKADKVVIVEDPVKVAARKAFLLSSAPEVLRTQLKELPVENSCGGHADFAFPKVTHVQQRDDDPFWSLKTDLTGVKTRLSDQFKVRDLTDFSGFLDTTAAGLKSADLDPSLNKLTTSNIRCLVSGLKVKTGLAVNKIFRRFVERKLQTEAIDIARRENKEEVQKLEKKAKRRSRKSKGVELDIEFSTERLSGEAWTHKYRPRHTEDMILNRSETKRLRGWLSGWTRQARGSSQSSNSTSESEGEDAGLADGGCALLTGPTGTGKTAAVYALAEELGMHVLEVNASSTRTGKQVTSMLLEATQSEQVRTGGQTKLNFFKPKEEVKPAAEKEDKKARKALILFEDIDIVFDEQDRGFYSAVSAIAAATKRPIVMTSSDPHAATIVSKSIRTKTQHFRFEEEFQPSLVSTHLQLMCLSEGYFISGSSLNSLASRSLSVRQCINTTQYIVQSGHLQKVESNEAEEEIVKKPKKKFVLADKVKLRDVSRDSEQSADEEESFTKYFPSKSSRGGSLQKYRLCSAEVVEYSHEQWFSQLANKCNYQQNHRADKYPLDSADEVKNIAGMQEVLRRTQPLSLTNPDIYDTEEGDETPAQDKEKMDDAEEEKPPCDQNKLDKQTISRRRVELETIFRHLDTVSEFSQHLESDCSKSFDGNQIEGLFDSILVSSGDIASRRLGLSTREDRPQPQPSKKHIEEEEDEVLGNLLDTRMLGDETRMDILAGLRNILRSEECRRVLCREGRRGGRFYHYLANNGVMLSKPATTLLCNSLQ